jgi:Na+/H+ antiporter NhaD/arsenite permease-like protein
LPFLALLLCIAVLPLATPHWWEHNPNKAIVSALLGAPVALYLALGWGAGGRHVLWHHLQEYVSFIILLGSLYVISGGIYIRGSLSGTPLANTILMAIGALLASLIGTTGASVLLIRPLLRANQSRQSKAHIIVFFIFIVSNCGGLLTPLGDPPLFLGFLRGVPFEWTLLELWPEWLAVNVALLAIFQIWDQIAMAREERSRAGSQLEEALEHEPLGMEGLVNFLFLGGVVATIYCSGRFGFPWGVQETIMTALALAAYFGTPARNREQNRFTFGPIIEVAVLFVGIFVTMAPALQMLNAWPGGQGAIHRLGIHFAMSEPWHYFWGTGILSGVLDNAPTYLTFAATASGSMEVPLEGAYLSAFLAKGDKAAKLLAAISCGAVFMGANTYIGNGPNFMVKAIAEENGVRTPSFFGYMLYSGAILIPVFVAVTIVFFWR